MKFIKLCYIIHKYILCNNYIFYTIKHLVNQFQTDVIVECRTIKWRGAQCAIKS